jgi:hypothetical protein
MKTSSLDDQLASRGFDAASILRKLPGGKLEISANRLHPLPGGGDDPVYASIPVNFTVTLDKNGVIKELAGGAATQNSVDEASRYLKMLQDTGQIRDDSKKESSTPSAHGFASGVTHEIRRDEKGRRLLQRVRF